MPEKLKLTRESYFKDPEVQETKMNVVSYIQKEFLSVGFDIGNMEEEDFNKYFEIEEDLFIMMHIQKMISRVSFMFDALGIDQEEFMRKMIASNGEENNPFNFDTNNN